MNQSQNTTSRLREQSITLVSSFHEMISDFNDTYKLSSIQLNESIKLASKFDKQLTSLNLIKNDILSISNEWKNNKSDIQILLSSLGNINDIINIPDTIQHCFSFEMYSDAQSLVTSCGRLLQDNPNFIIYRDIWTSVEMVIEDHYNLCLKRFENEHLSTIQIIKIFYFFKIFGFTESEVSQLFINHRSKYFNELLLKLINLKHNPFSFIYKLINLYKTIFCDIIYQYNQYFQENLIDTMDINSYEIKVNLSIFIQSNISKLLFELQDINLKFSNHELNSIKNNIILMLSSFKKIGFDISFYFRSFIKSINTYQISYYEKNILDNIDINIQKTIFNNSLKTITDNEIEQNISNELIISHNLHFTNAFIELNNFISVYIDNFENNIIIKSIPLFIKSIENILKVFKVQILNKSQQLENKDKNKCDSDLDFLNLIFMPYFYNYISIFCKRNNLNYTF